MQAHVGRRCKAATRSALGAGSRRWLATRALGSEPPRREAGDARARPGRADQRRTCELREQMLPPSRTGFRFADFEGSAYGLSETTKQVCLLPTFLALHQPAEPPSPPVGWRQRWLLLEGGAHTEVLQEKLARALAAELDAHFLLLRLDGLAAAALPGEAGGSGPAAGGGGPRLRSRRVAELAGELEELVEELGDAMHGDALAKCDRFIDSTLAAAAAAAARGAARGAGSDDGAADAGAEGGGAAEGGGIVLSGALARQMLAEAGAIAEAAGGAGSAAGAAGPAGAAGAGARVGGEALVPSLLAGLEGGVLQAELRALRAVLGPSSAAEPRRRVLLLVHGGDKVPSVFKLIQRAIRRLAPRSPLFAIGTSTLPAADAPARAVLRRQHARYRRDFGATVTLQAPAFASAANAAAEGGAAAAGGAVAVSGAAALPADGAAAGAAADPAAASSAAAAARWAEQLRADARSHTLASNLDGLARALSALAPERPGRNVRLAPSLAGGLAPGLCGARAGTSRAEEGARGAARGGGGGGGGLAAGGGAPAAPPLRSLSSSAAGAAVGAGAGIGAARDGGAAQAEAADPAEAGSDAGALGALGDGSGFGGNGGSGDCSGCSGDVLPAVLSARLLAPAELQTVASWALADGLMRRRGAGGHEREEAGGGPGDGDGDGAGADGGGGGVAVSAAGAHAPGLASQPPAVRAGAGGKGALPAALELCARSVGRAVRVLESAYAEGLLPALAGAAQASRAAAAAADGAAGLQHGGGGQARGRLEAAGGGSEGDAEGARGLGLLGGGGGGGGGSGRGARKKCEYEATIERLVVPSSSLGVRFADVGALADVKASLLELVSLPLQQPQLFAAGVSRHATQGVLLSGPPGTGKTMLAKAVATESGASFINVSMAEITSKWYGEDEKHVAAIFRVARRLAPCVIFLDEIDSLLGRRGSAHEHEATRRLRNEFLAQWDGLLSASSAGQRVLVLGATNRPFDLDEAALRRLPRRLALALPDGPAREQILRVLLTDELGSVRGRHLDLAHLAGLTEGYSGSDLKHLCTTAALAPIRELLSSAGAAALARGAEPLSPDALRPLTHADFEAARARTRPSVSAQLDVTKELNKWHRMFAEGAGARTATGDSIGF